MDEAEYRPGVQALGAGDVLVLYTDGVTEAANAAGEEFGGQRLAGFVTQDTRRSAQELVSGVYREVIAFTGNRQTVRNLTRNAQSIEYKQLLIYF